MKTSRFALGWLASSAIVALLVASTACTGKIEAQQEPLPSGDAGTSSAASTGDGSVGTSDASSDAVPTGIGDSSVGGGLVTLATNQALYYPISLAVDPVNVYWTAGTSDGRVMAVPVAGGSVFTLAPGQNGALGIAASGTTVFWTDANGGTVMRGGTGSAPVTLASGQMNPSAIAVYQSTVYWEAVGAIMRWQGGVVQTVASDPSVGSGSLFNAIAAGSTGVYWTEDFPANAGGGGAVVFAPLSGGVKTLAKEPTGAYGIAVDTQNVYWTTPTALVKMPLAGGSATTLATSPASFQALSVAVDSTSVYWTTAGSVMKFTPK